eukprot:6872941-Pyramimonas_sp.AAC.1
MPKVASTLMQHLQVPCLPLSYPKLALLASNPDITRSIVEQVPALRKAPRKTTRNLGVDYAHRPSKGLARSALKHRLKNTKSRALRLAQLRKAGGRAQQMTRASVRPVAMYGTH